MDKTLISCVGMRDPFDAKSPEYFGAVLACVLKVQPKKVILFRTEGTAERAQATVRLMKQLFGSIESTVVDAQIDDPSNFSEVDVALRRALIKLARARENCFVNLSSGTPQMALSLSLMLGTGFITGTGIKVLDPQFKTDKTLRRSEESGQNSAIQLTENREQVETRSIVLTHVDLPIIEHITRANAITLCERFDYSGALELLEWTSPVFTDTNLE
jgi:hypothetical protein